MKNSKLREILEKRIKEVDKDYSNCDAEALNAIANAVSALTVVKYAMVYTGELTQQDLAKEEGLRD